MSASHTPLRIGVLTAFPPSQGSLNEFGYHLVRHLASKDQVSEVVLYCDETEAGDPAAMPRVVVVPCWRFNRLGSLVRIIRAVRRTRPDAVLFNLQFATFGDRKIPGALGLLAPALLRLTVPTVVVLHNLADNVDMRDAGFAGSRATAALMSVAGRIMTRLLLRASLVAVTIPRYVEQLRERYRADNVVLTPHGSFDDHPLPTVEASDDGPPRILAFGKWGTYKTVDILIGAYQELLVRGYPNAQLVIAGPDSPNSPGYLAGVSKKYAHLPGITLTGYVPEEDVPALFKSATVVAFPYTSTTGSSGVLHQAGEYGRAVVLPRIGDLVEVIEEEGFVGQYFQPDDPVTLTDALATLLANPERRTELGRINFAAALGIPLSEVVDWHLIHIRRLLLARQKAR